MLLVSRESILLALEQRYGSEYFAKELSSSLADFVRNEGKNIRSLMFLSGYFGFSDTEVHGLYETAYALELLHDFILIHDDIIDRADQRRGKVSLHRHFDEIFIDNSLQKPSFQGTDLALITADILYAVAIKFFLTIDVIPERKDRALNHFVDAGVITGCGQFNELIYSKKNIKDLSKEQIYTIYDAKTSYYSFIAPLITGAILGGADPGILGKLKTLGIYIGRAFQLYDDLKDIVSSDQIHGKDCLKDFSKGIKTIPLWLLYHYSDEKQQVLIQSLFEKGTVSRENAALLQTLFISEDIVTQVQVEINSYVSQAHELLKAGVLCMRSIHLLEEILSKYLSTLPLL